MPAPPSHPTKAPHFTLHARRSQRISHVMLSFVVSNLEPSLSRVTTYRGLISNGCSWSSTCPVNDTAYTQIGLLTLRFPRRPSEATGYQASSPTSMLRTILLAAAPTSHSWMRQGMSVGARSASWTAMSRGRMASRFGRLKAAPSSGRISFPAGGEMAESCMADCR
jgi:hypothetical protein